MKKKGKSEKIERGKLTAKKLKKRKIKKNEKAREGKGNGK